MVVRRRSIVLLVLGLVSIASIFYLTVDVRTVEFNGSYHTQYVSSEDVQIRRVLQVDVTTTSDKVCSMYRDYCVISPYNEEVRNASKTGSVTLCTQGTVEFLQHVVVLCHRWSAPISVAVYSPEEDYTDARLTVQLLRQCDFCVRNWVNWHFFYNGQTQLPLADQSQLPRDCSSIVQVKKKRKRKSRGIYPINVGRNIARNLAATPFVFSIDIELYPSLDIPAKFERMLRSQVLSPDNQVWVFPVFEVQYTVRAPHLKSQLKTMFAKKQAISFHLYRCNICHKIPNLTQWMSHEGSKSEMEESLEPLRIWNTVKRSRHFKLQEWEPFFIGTNQDPEFDVRLSWEGKQNKMQMAYEMCMRDYDFHIIENAFLVHAPGINIYNATKEKERERYSAQNRKVINMVKKNLTRKYGSKNNC